MRTDRGLATLAALAALALAFAPGLAAAEVKVDADTQVRAFHFRWTGTQTIPERQLRPVLVSKDRGGAYGLRRALGKLPVIDPPSHVPFDPVELQRDVVRLRARYRDAGFPRADVRYEVEKDDEENLIEVTFVLTEGP